MKYLILMTTAALGLVCSPVLANELRKECLGRHVFEVPEDIEWAVFHPEYINRVSEGGGHGFGRKVGAKGDSTVYGPYGSTIKVSAIVERSQFEAAAEYQIGTGRLYQKQLLKDLESHKRLLEQFESGDYPNSIVEDRLRRINEIKKKIPLAIPTVHELDIPDAYFIGDHEYPTHAYLYRNSRVYFFTTQRAGNEGARAFIDLMSRFQPRELYEVPEENGICIPYGFISDDGRTPYSIKNSLRFTSTPNVVFTLLTASASDPWHTTSTAGLYDTDFRPGYDSSKWTWREYVQPSYLGRHKVNLLGWTLEPKPDSGEQERAWFGYATRGGMLNPRLAVHMLTFDKGVDDLTEHTPPMDTVLPQWEALARTLRWRGE
ncbi:T6SS immunity protein Tli4 family protein [Halopseudomonas pertucinogena]|uniref:Tle cognate immunity protein 4 C-terminal domain-containing protein n=1 Tax=Halopseudomonas pertucinogena TaxID=86175 RepID=A0ABQ2CHW0_9GAMM|nr:T6SS immunity protein Tli4 family protein [Halopseudomonas pertucinogena]GGI90310.1 hypothetical protein GCM10009083_03350 [Halopseudomonas pertucinogena]